MDIMDKQTKIITLLKNTSEINTYVSFLQNCLTNRKITTRSVGRLATAACRIWQLQYCILTLIYDKPKYRDFALHEDSKFLNILCNPYYNIFSSPTSKLYNFISQNDLPKKLPKNLPEDLSEDLPEDLPEDRSVLCYVDNKVDFEKYIKNDIHTNIYLCVYGRDKRDKSNKTISRNGVCHYFTIIKEHNNYYLTSSYGSSWIKVPYGIIEIQDIEDFFKFCEQLAQLAQLKDTTTPENITANRKAIAEFMEKYFLSNGVKQRYSDDDIDNAAGLFSLWIPVNLGIEKEINYILDNYLMNFDIAIITNYEELVKNELVAMKYNYKEYDYVRQLINPPGVAPLDVDPLDVAPPGIDMEEEEPGVAPLGVGHLGANPPGIDMEEEEPGVAPLGVGHLGANPPGIDMEPEGFGGGSIKYKKNKSQKNNIILILNKYKKNKTKKVKD